MIDHESQNHSRLVQLALSSTRVTAAFRAEIFSAADRAGMTVNEFVVEATAEKLRRAGRQFPGPFRDSELRAA
jgi:hypothetical protein